ncbi:MAG: hypothetical protein AAFN27_08730 [Pseudomonadota bacterium]
MAKHGELAVLQRLAFAAIIWSATLGIAAADPVGTYSVEGVSAGTGDRYSGSVEVSRSGDRYIVEWNLDGAARSGVAMGGAFSQGSFVIGPAHQDDLMLAIGFSDQSGFGTATMFLQPTGSYEGFVVHSDATLAGQETWTVSAQ